MKKIIDKSIVLVGNGAILKEQKLGYKINQFDEVIRINDWKTKEFEEIAGLKTTIWGMYNPIKCGNNFIKYYKSQGYEIEEIRDIIKDIEEIWYICWNPDNILTNWKSNQSIKDLNVYDKCKRHISIPISRRIRGITNPPSTGFILIWLLSHMYNKIYLIGFDFGGMIHTEGNLNHYFGDKTKEFVKENNIHNLQFEHNYVNKLIKDNKIEILTKYSIVDKGKFIGKYKSPKKCIHCNSIINLYDWEQNICNYCEEEL